MTRISVTVKPNAKQEKVEQAAPSEFTVWVRAQAHDGKANQAVLARLSSFFDIPKSHLTILRGHASRTKIIAIV